LDVATVILNWSGLEDTIRCLKSLHATKDSTIRLRTTVIDNGSKNDPCDEIQRNFPNVECLRNETNIGYAAGCNLGAKRAFSRGADFVLFLNNDTIVEPNLFEELAECFSQNPQIGVASPIVYDMSNPPRIDFAGGRINFALGRFLHRHGAPQATTPFETEYVSGCCMMISKTTIDRIGLFDERLFAYFEDVDLCLRARRAGLGVVCVPGATVFHKGSASTRRGLSEGTTSALKHYLIARNRVVIVDRYASRPAKWFHLLISNPLRTFFYVAAFVGRGRWVKLRWFLRGMRDAFRGKLETPIDLIRVA
jgi:GT2 family glycosyltransferase